MVSIRIYFQISFLIYLCSFAYTQYHENRGRRGVQKTPMTSAIPLTDEDHDRYLSPLVQKGWIVDRNISIPLPKMRKDFIFRSFFGAFGFMTNIAMHCEETNHFPEWFNVYKVVKITLSTKHIKSLSINDVNLANYVEDVYIIYKEV